MIEDPRRLLPPHEEVEWADLPISEQMKGVMEMLDYIDSMKPVGKVTTHYITTDGTGGSEWQEHVEDFGNEADEA